MVWNGLGFQDFGVEMQRNQVYGYAPSMNL